MRVTKGKTWYCHTCKKAFHWLGITRHRAMHRDKNENCKIEDSVGNIHTWKYKKEVYA